jgi:hypothetical protein
VSFFNVFNLPLVLYMDFWIKHTVHHRGQLSMHLRAMNARVPDIYGGSADEPFAMPATVQVVGRASTPAAGLQARPVPPMPAWVFDRVRGAIPYASQHVESGKCVGLMGDDQRFG